MSRHIKADGTIALPRRAFLRAALVGTGLVYMGALAGCDDGGTGGTDDAFVNPPTPDAGPPPPPMGADWDDHLANAQAAEVPYFGANADGPQLIGERYLARVAPDADPEALAELLGSTIALLDAEDGAQAAEAAAAQVAIDFDTLTLISQDGWTLSQTEVHLCALVYLATAA